MTRELTSPARTLLAAAPRLKSVWTVWLDRHVTRTALNKLDTHMLRDIGMNPSDARSEATKAFWQD